MEQHDDGTCTAECPVSDTNAPPKPVLAFPDHTTPTVDVLGMAIRGYAAENRELGVHIRASRGRRRLGSPTRWTVTYRSATGEEEHFHLTAFTGAEALEKANRRLAKLGVGQ